jgi:surface protein
VSGVADFSWAFSQHRNQAGGSIVVNGNPKAATFVGTAMSKWITTSATSLHSTFNSAGEMNSDLSGWNVAKVTTLSDTFNSASKFAGMGLGSWDTTSVTTLQKSLISN